MEQVNKVAFGGLLWYDGEKKKAALQKIEEGVLRYSEKFELVPNAVQVNPADLCQHPRLIVVENRLIQPNHFLIGQVESEETPLSIAEV
jgi:hypothetical protein